MKILVTGTSSGLGKFLFNKFNAESFNRISHKNHKKHYDVIIHCAYNLERNITNNNIIQYLDDTITLTKKLINLECDLFVFISTIDVYNSKNVLNTENKSINIYKQKNIYSLTKVICEEIIKKKTKKNLILRSGLLIGKGSRKNSITKIIRNFTKINLSNNSNFYCIHYNDIEKIIKSSIENKITGTFNCVLKPSVKLGDIAKKYSKSLTFGDFTYCSPKVSNKKLLKYFNFLKHSSMDCIEANIQSLK